MSFRNHSRRRNKHQKRSARSPPQTLPPCLAQYRPPGVAAAVGSLGPKRARYQRCNQWSPSELGDQRGTQPTKGDSGSVPLNGRQTGGCPAFRILARHRKNGSSRGSFLGWKHLEHQRIWPMDDVQPMQGAQACGGSSSEGSSGILDIYLAVVEMPHDNL